jgi:hypothetical protein
MSLLGRLVFVPVFVFALFFGGIFSGEAAAQNPEAVALGQEAVRERIITENGGAEPTVLFDVNPEIRVLSSEKRRVTGLGTYRGAGATPEARFTYEVEVEQSGRVRRANYKFLSLEAGNRGPKPSIVVSIAQKAMQQRVKDDYGRPTRVYFLLVETELVNAEEEKVRGLGYLISQTRGRIDFSYETTVSRRFLQAFDLKYGDVTKDAGKPEPSTEEPGRMSWRGRVDDWVRVNVRGQAAFAITFAGQYAPPGEFNFEAPLPRAAVTVKLEKKRGRGEVRIAQQPTYANGYTAVIEIRDRRRKDDEYEFVLKW